MPPTKRVLVFCLSMDVQKPLKAFEYYRPDKAFMLCMTGNDMYKDYKVEIESQIPPGVSYQSIEVKVYDFKVALAELLRILREERKSGNRVYVDLTGPAGFSSAAMVASMMEDGTPFFSGTKDYTLDYKEYYEGKRPVGISKSVYDPYELPIFSLERPDDDLVHGLAVWSELHEKGGLMTDSRVIKSMETAGLMSDIFDERMRVTLKAKMRYRRHYLDKWLQKGWVRAIGRGKYEITGAGSVAVRVFR
jgi:hypothetical protein